MQYNKNLPVVIATKFNNVNEWSKTKEHIVKHIDFDITYKNKPTGRKEYTSDQNKIQICLSSKNWLSNNCLTEVSNKMKKDWIVAVSPVLYVHELNRQVITLASLVDYDKEFDNIEEAQKHFDEIIATAETMVENVKTDINVYLHR